MSKNKDIRQLSLIAMLLEATRPVTLDEIRKTLYPEDQEFPAFKRMFERDKKELKDLGVPLDMRSTDPEGYQIDPDHYFLPDLHLEPDERMALVLARRLMAASGVPKSYELSNAIAKLSADLGTLGLGQPLPCETAERLGEKMASIHGAIDRCKTMRFDYRAADGSQSARGVHPYLVYPSGGRWLVYAFDLERDAIRNFRVSRMSGIRVDPGKDRDFERPKIDPASIPKGPWEFRQADAVQARIRFRPRRAWQVENEKPAQASVIREKDGGLVLEMPVANPEGLAPWLAGYGTDAELLGPPELREHFRGWLVRALEAAGGRP